MGRLGQWVSNAFNRVRNFGIQAGSTLTKVAPKIIRGGQFVTGVLSKLPGTIGTAAGLIHKGLDYANRFIEALPNSRFKDKLQDLSDKGSNAVNTIHKKITPAVETAKVIGEQGSKVLDAIGKTPII